MKIEILGPGCPKCHNTEENVKKALSQQDCKDRFLLTSGSAISCRRTVPVL